MAKSQGSLGVKAGAKGKGSASKREEKRKAKFAPKTLGGAKANVLSDPSDTPPAAKKRPREESVPVAAGSKKPYKQGAFARAAPPPRAAPEEPQQPLSKKEMKSLVEARKSASKPNFALIQARSPGSARRRIDAAAAPPRRPSPAHSRLAAASGADCELGEAPPSQHSGGGAGAADGTPPHRSRLCAAHSCRLRPRWLPK